ncbi:MAG: 3-isopropylmalate dehydratase small subunit [Clostridiales bacterium]|nr:3-isopropylmalate dehydratase small subunit [Clostridiales bacterium]
MGGELRFQGRAFVFEDNIDTDAIFPANWLILTDEKEIASHCMEEIDPDFHRKAKPGDILLAGANFGCGSSREHAPLAIRGCGISCVVAKSFSRLFYRNAVNIGLPVITADTASLAAEGDEVAVDCVTGEISIRKANAAAGAVVKLAGEPLPEFMLEILRSSGLYGYLEKRLKLEGRI